VIDMRRLMMAVARAMAAFAVAGSPMPNRHDRRAAGER
jgi:hypothetical protein